MKRLLFSLLGASLFFLSPLGAKDLLADGAYQSGQNPKDDPPGEFIPWYTGPLLAPTATTLYPGQVYVQPYIFVNDDYGAYNNQHRFTTSERKLVVQSLNLLQFGIAPHFDCELIPSAQWSWEGGAHSTRFEDFQFRLGGQIVYEERGTYQPSVRITLTETFPTGQYENLSPSKNSTDSSGMGSYGTTLGIISEKTVFWLPRNPFRFRFTLHFTRYSSVKVRGLNTYGGSVDTDGTVHPGKGFLGIFSTEASLSQNWVLALDIQYTVNSSTRFDGIHGATPEGVQAPIGAQASQQISLAPALEYNFSDRLGVIGGVWFSVYGKNITDFFSGAISLTYLYGNR